MEQILKTLLISIMVTILGGLAYYMGVMASNLKWTVALRKKKEGLKEVAEDLARGSAYALASESGVGNKVRLRALILTDYVDKLDMYLSLASLSTLVEVSGDDELRQEYTAMVNDLREMSKAVVKRAREMEKQDSYTKEEEVENVKPY